MMLHFKDLKRHLLFLLLFVIFHISQCRRNCGGIYSKPRGVLQTPNFPNPFPVPIECEWVIEVPNMGASTPANTSIIVYLTQLFVFEGLSFTEYQLYDSGYNINGRTIHQVNETNISRVRWVQTYQNYLVIRLSLQTVDSTHLRVLDRFLDVYGFNITYEITNHNVRKDSCTMMDCGFTGICYDHYTRFSCDCFYGYSGPHCSMGPNSVCYTDGNPICRNGGTCIHVGASAVKCHCTKEFLGNTCETPAKIPTKECENCPLVCPYDGKLENACKCESKSVLLDRPGFITSLYLANLPNLDEYKLKLFIKNQILRNIRSNHTRVDDIIIEKIHYENNEAEVTVSVLCNKKDEKRVRSVINKWIDRGYIENITISGKDATKRKTGSLHLESLSINQQGIIREKDEFILSCVARGSPSIQFRWFKDGMFVNTSTSSRKWTRLIKDPRQTDQYTALLAIERAETTDSGSFTCQVDDLNVQNCLSHSVVVRNSPIVKIEPMSMTVKKGDNFTIKCFTLDENGVKYTYSWTKNKELLRVRTQTEKYEILYPSGTILQIYNVEKDVQYSCLVQGDSLHGEKIIDIHVVDREGVRTCPRNFYINLLWPETAPNTYSIQECPKGYMGVAFRSCSLRDERRPVWGMPDYSDCTHSILQNVQYKFKQLTLGYMSTTPEELMQNTLNYVQRNNSFLLPGEGARILTFLHDIIIFINNSKMSYSTTNLTKSLFSTVDKILLDQNSLLNQSHIRLLEEVVSKYLKLFSKQLLNNQSGFHSQFPTIDYSVLDVSKNSTAGVYKIPFWNNSYKHWFGIQINGNALEDDIRTTIVYRNLSNFFPPRSFLRTKDGLEIEYVVYSQIIHTWTTIQHSEEDFIIINFRHNSETVLNVSNEKYWSLKCASADISTFTYTWNINSCQTVPISDYTSQCICPQDGIYTLLVTTFPFKVSEDHNDSRRYILVAGCSLCMMLSLFTTACLATSCWLLRRTCLAVLKLQCSISIFSIALLFTMATITGPQQKYFLILISALKIFFLMGMSSHLSKLLIVFTELVQLPRPVTSKQTVIGIISGVPIITVFGNHLAYRTMDLKLTSWWMLIHTLSFYIYITVSTIIILLFVFIYIIVMKKLTNLMETHDKHTRPIVKRVALLRRSGILFTAITLLSISSIIYINMPNCLWALYQFSGMNILMGILLLVCYVLKAETEFTSLFTNKSGSNKDDKFFSMDSTSSPLNFLTRQESDLTKSGSSIKLEYKQQSSKNSNNDPSSNQRHNNDLLYKTQSISATFESCLHTSTSFCDGSSKKLNEIQGAAKNSGDSGDNLELYNTSPQQYRKFSCYNSNPTTCSPDILSSKMFVELDLVASVQNAATTIESSPKLVKETTPVAYPMIIVTPDEFAATTTVQDVKKPLPAVVVERTQPDGHEKAANVTNEVKETQPSSSSDNLDGMLDRISHDLDYLLNGKEQPTTATIRRSRTPSCLGVIHQIDEEDDDSVNEATNC